MPLKRKLLLFVMLLVVGVCVTAVDLLVLYPKRPHTGPKAVHRVVIPEGIGPKGLSNLLHGKNLITSPGRFSLWLRLTGGVAGIRAGEFELTGDMSPEGIVERLGGRGVGKGIKVVFPEGFTLREMGNALQLAGIVTGEEFIAAATSKDSLKAKNAPGPTFEGYLFPDTYYFDPATGPDGIVEKMHRTFLNHLSVLGIKDTEDLKSLVTLASIVQAETSVVNEMPIVAGVYANRLKSSAYPSRLLQADPTVSYGCEPFVVPRAPSCRGFNGQLKRRQLDDSENPYNTYRRPGLPPGPICAPGLDALKAAAQPKDVPFLFFVASAKRDGTHVFSETLEAHQKAVDAYWSR